MRPLFFVLCLFLLQLTITADEIDSVEHAEHFVDNVVEHGIKNVSLVGPAISGFVSLGKMIVSVVGEKGSDEERQAMVGEIREMSTKIDLMNEKIQENLLSIKSFVVEHDFYTKFVVPAEAQFDLLRDVLRDNTHESIDLFKKHYGENHPIVNVVEISKLIAHHNGTNPIVSAMHAKPLRTKETFEKWTTCIHNLYTTMHISYLFSEGLNGRNVSESEQVIDMLIEAGKHLAEFVHNYKLDYWPHIVERIMFEVAEQTDENHLTKARMLKDALEQIETEDSFLILVSDHSEDGEHDHTFASVNNSTLMVWRGESPTHVVIVYRSEKAREMDNSRREDLMWDTEWQKRQDCWRDDEGLKNSANSMLKGIQDAGIVALYSPGVNVAVRTVGDYNNRPWFVKTECIHPDGDWAPIELYVAFR